MGTKHSKPTSRSFKKRLFGVRSKSGSHADHADGAHAGQNGEPLEFTIHDPGPPEISHNESIDRDDVISAHLKLVEKLGAIWSEYSFMDELNLNELDTESIERMNAVFQHLLNQNTAIRNLTAEKDQMTGDRGLEGAPSSAAKKRSQFKRASSYEVLDADDGADARAQLMAEVKKMREAAQKSTISRYSKEGSFEQSTNSLKRQEKVEEMKEKVRLLEQIVEEKERTIQELEQNKKRNRHSQQESFSHRKGTNSAEVRQHISVKIKEEHQRLEHVMMNQIKPEIDRVVRFTDDQTKFTFLCSVVMDLYTICLKHREEFDYRLQYLLLHPTRLQPETESKKKKKLITLITLPSNEERTRSSSSYVETQEIPKPLKREALKFVAATSPYLDTKILVQEAMNQLSIRYDRITSKMADNELFQTFVSDCARMTWQIRIVEPPMRLCADLDLLYNDDLHLPYRSMKVRDAELEYYLWPVLMEGDGTVACKGRVAFKVSQLEA